MAKVKFVGVRIDVETKSETDIKAGSYKYAEDPSFENLVVAYSPLRQHPGGAIGQGKPRLLDLYNSKDVQRFADIIQDDRFEKHAYNANFERVTLSRWLGMGDGEFIDPKNWHCSAIRANVSGIFGTLDDVAKALRSPIKKDPRGKALIKMFSVPMNVAAQKKANTTCGCQTFHDPDAHPADFKMYQNYCMQDVVTETVVANLTPPIPAQQQTEYEMDQRINDRGIRHFKAIAESAVDAVTIESSRLMNDLKDLTGLSNPNSVQQFRGWLAEQDYEMSSLDKAHREEALADPLIPDIVSEALELKGAASLTSVSKHKAALKSRGNDGRIRGTLQFYGAHTGREAGRVIQPQNLPRAEAKKADIIRMLRGQAGRDALEIAKGSVRASLIPRKGHLFVGVDYNAIEARTLGNATGEKWVEDEFRYGAGKIYEATAAMMFGVNKDALVKAISATHGCDKCGHCADCGVRGKAKISNLALGYQGGAGALVTMGAEKEGIDVGNYPELHAEWKALGMPGKFWQWERDRHDYPELLRLRDLYRDASPQTVRFWNLCAAAWDQATAGKTMHFGQNNMFAMMRDGKHNRLILPSGRSIWYRYAASHYDPDRDKVDRRTFIGKGQGVGHVRTDTHGGKLTENINQAYARDVLFDVMLKIEDALPGLLVLHVHDEVLLEVPKAHADDVLAQVKDMMSIPPDWAPDLVVKGEGEVMERYKK